MSKVSRTELARSVAQALLDGKDQKKLMRQVAAYFIDHNMTSQLDMFIDDLSVELETRTGHATATAVVAHSLGAESLKELEAYVREKTGAKSVELTVEEDPSIVGGVIIRTPQYEYDASVRHKLNQLAQGRSLNG
jgi:F0F1-type ATP synthase delta subunit